VPKQIKQAGIRYDEGCLAAHALNLVGDRWALLLVRELMFSAKRFQMIRAGLPGITASVLTARLAQLLEAGVVNHEGHAGMYSLTSVGRGLLPVLESLCRWAMTVPGHNPSRFISPSALMISMGVNLVRKRAKEREALACFDFGNEMFEMRLRGSQLQTLAVTQSEAPFALSGSGNAVAAAVYGNGTLKGLIRSNTFRVGGDVAAAQEFVGLFELKAPD
jgi:DNA-binding HxlR family transcriptional regulator